MTCNCTQCDCDRGLRGLGAAAPAEPAVLDLNDDEAFGAIALRSVIMARTWENWAADEAIAVVRRVAGTAAEHQHHTKSVLAELEAFEVMAKVVADEADRVRAVLGLSSPQTPDQVAAQARRVVESFRSPGILPELARRQAIVSRAAGRIAAPIPDLNSPLAAATIGARAILATIGARVLGAMQLTQHEVTQWSATWRTVLSNLSAGVAAAGPHAFRGFASFGGASLIIAGVIAWAFFFGRPRRKGT